MSDNLSQDTETNKAIRHMSVLLETVIDQSQAVLEAVGLMQAQIKDLPTRTEFNEVKTDIKTIKAAVTDTSKQVHAHERLLTKLKPAQQ